MSDIEQSPNMPFDRGARAVTATSQDDLGAIAEEILGEPIMEVGPFEVERIGNSIGQATVGIYTVTGQATTTGGQRVLVGGGKSAWCA